MCFPEEEEQTAWLQELQFCPTPAGDVPAPSASLLLLWRCLHESSVPCLHLHLQGCARWVTLALTQTSSCVQGQCQATPDRAAAHTEPGLCCEGDTENPSSLGKSASRILLHSSQTGWHPNRALHPQTAAAGHESTHAGQCWSRLGGSYGGNAVARRAAVLALHKAPHAVCVGQTPHACPKCTPYWRHKTHSPTLLKHTAASAAHMGNQVCVLQTQWGTSHSSHTRGRQDLSAAPAFPVQLSQPLPFLHWWD